MPPAGRRTKQEQRNCFLLDAVPTTGHKCRLPIKLVLNQWLLSLFNVERFEQLAEYLRTRSWRVWTRRTPPLSSCAHSAALQPTKLPTELLLEYDQNIVKHTLRLNDRADYAVVKSQSPEVFPVSDAALYRRSTWTILLAILGAAARR